MKLLRWDLDDIKQVHSLGSLYIPSRLTTGHACKSTIMTCWPGRVSAVMRPEAQQAGVRLWVHSVYYTGIFLSTETLQGLKSGLGFS